MRVFARAMTAVVLLACVLAACQMASPDAGLQDEPIAVTPLAAPEGATPEAAAVAAPEVPVAEQADMPVEAVPAAEPQEAKSPEQMLCEKANGQWVAAGQTGAYYCASMTRDGGKQCSKKTQCQGQCLARSGTCAPIMPLYGCNDVLEKDGRQVTLCID